MKNFMKTGALLLLGFITLSALQSCSDDDPDYNDVTPPTVAEVHNISGSIAGIDGKGINGATVTMSGAASGTATTDANGYFVFDNVAVGTYNLSVAASGKISKSTTVEVTTTGNGKNVVWNVMLASEESTTDINVVQGEANTDNTVTTEHLDGNDKAEVEVTVDVPADATNKNATITVSPIYSADEAVSAATKAVTRASSTENAMLTGAKLSCSTDGVTIENPIDLIFNVDSETSSSSIKVQKYNNSTGNWEDVSYTVGSNGEVIVKADEFTSYGIFLGVTFSSTSSSKAITFAQSEWNNLYGSGDMNVGTATYEYKVGMDITSSGTTKFTALLIEKLAQYYGAASYTTQGGYPVNVTLPIGTALKISGTQQYNTVTASAAGRGVSGTQYGDVTVSVTTYNRQHTGSSN